MNKLKRVKWVVFWLAGLLVAKTILNNKSELKREISSINDCPASLINSIIVYGEFFMLFGEKFMDETIETVEDIWSTLSDICSSYIGDIGDSCSSSSD